MRHVNALLFASVLAGCTNGQHSTGPAQPGGDAAVTPAQAENANGAPFREGVELAPSEDQLNRGIGGNNFDFASVGSLWVRVKLHGMPGVAGVRLNFISPQGATFFETTLHFTPDATAQQMPGAPSVYNARQLNGGYALDYPVPIAGSIFTRFPKPGNWTVEAIVDSPSLTLSAPMTVSYSR